MLGRAITGDNALPRLGEMNIGLYRNQRRKDEVMELLLSELRCAYGG